VSTHHTLGLIPPTYIVLQQSRALRIIKQRLVKKSIDMMVDLAANNETAYGTFWKNFGKYLKVICAHYHLVLSLLTHFIYAPYRSA
jgi:HSP90 family molecular chaperone